MTDLPTLIARLRELEKTATAAPWRAEVYGQMILAYDDAMTVADMRGIGYLSGVLKLDTLQVNAVLDSNCELIVELRNSLLPVLTAYESLLAASVSQQRRIERLEEENAELRNQPKVERRMSEHLTFVEERTS